MIIVSHDRDFLDNVVTSTLVFEDNGKVEHYVGGYSDWLKYGKDLKDQESPLSLPKTTLQNSANESSPVAAKTKKLSYKLQRELDELPNKIDLLEKEIAKLEVAMAAPGFYQQDADKVQLLVDGMSEKQKQLDQAIARWAELEE